MFRRGYIFLQGSWEKKLIERVHNCCKSSKKRVGAELDAPPVKRGRPKKEDPIFKRYPPLLDVDVDEEKVEALQLEMEKEKPRKDVILTLNAGVTFSTKNN